jgi:16S rRNA processing protein RimM
MTDPNAWVPLAEIARPHGVHGELRLKVFNEDSDLLLGVDEVLVRLAGGEEHEVSVISARRAQGGLLMKLHSVEDRDRAEQLRGAFVCIRRRDFPPVEHGEFYTVDIVGGEARLGGKRFGEVTDIVSYPTVQALVVRSDDGPIWEVPLTATYIESLDSASRSVELKSLDDLEPLPAKKPKVRKPRRGRPGKGNGDTPPSEG